MLNLHSWARWFLHRPLWMQAVFVGLPALFGVAVPFAFRSRQMRGVWQLWVAMLLLLVPLGWYQWAAQRSNESPNLPLFDIAFYALPIGAVTVVGAYVMRWCASRQQSLPIQCGAAILSMTLSAPLLMPLASYGALLIYMLTGGFI